MNIRIAKAEDCESVYRLICELEEETLDKTSFKNVYKNLIGGGTNTIILAENDGQIIGVLDLHIAPQLHHTGNIAEIAELYTNSAQRSQGVGSELVNYAKKLAKEQKCVNLEVCCNLKRLRAHEFYGKNGLVKTHYKLTMALESNNE